MFEAWSEVWTVGSADAIRVGNALVTAVADVIGAATVRGQGRGSVMRLLAGEKWTSEQLGHWRTRFEGFARQRRAFAEIARKELGSEVADVFAGSEPPA